MDAFANPELKRTEDLMRGFAWYMAQPILLTQQDVDRFMRICEELLKRDVCTF